MKLLPFQNRDSSVATAPVVGPILLAGIGCVVVMALLVVIGAKKALAAALGIMFLFALVEWPILGLILVILSGTFLQVLGSPALTGLPLSVGKSAGMLTMVAWFYLFMRRRIAWTYSPQMIALAFFVAAMVVNTLLVRPLQPSDENGFIRFLQAFVVFWLMANLAGTSRQALLTAAGALTAGLLGCGIIGAVEHFVPSMMLEFDDMALAEGAVGAIVDRDSLEGVALLRITGGLGDSNWLAATLAAVMPLNIYWWWRSRTLWGKAFVAGIAVIQALALVLSYTRAGFLGLGVAILFLTWRRVIAPQMLLWGGIAMVIAGLIYLPPGFMDRFFSVKYLQEGSTPVRKALTGTALRFALDRPILGYGYGQFGIEFIHRVNTTDVRNTVGVWGTELVRSVEDGREQARNLGTHNLVLEVMVEYGLLGLIPFLAFISLVFHDLRFAARWGDADQRLLALCVAAGLIALLVCGLLIHAKYLKILWFLAGFAAAQRRVILTEYWRPDTASAPPNHDPVPPAGGGRRSAIERPAP